MMHYRSLFTALTAAAVICVCTGRALPAANAIPVEKPKVPDYIAKALADPAGRPWSQYRRDPLAGYAELYAFAQIKPGDKVIELYPGTVEYNVSQISRIIGPTGHFYSVTFLRDLDQAWELRDAQAKSKSDYAPLQIDYQTATADVTEFNNMTPLWEAANQFGGNIAIPEQVDVVFDDHYHDNHDLHTGNLDMVAVNKSLFRATKPGGTYMAMDSTAADGRGNLDAPRIHKMEPKTVIAEITAAGWLLEAEDDTWHRDDDTYHANSQCHHCRDMSDRFAFRFRKPLNAPGDMRPKGTDPMADYYGNTLVYDMGYRDIHPGSFPRHRFYNKNGTFEEYGYESEVGAREPDPLRMGTWFWDASGHNCLRIEYPAPERALTYCNNYIVPREFNKVEEVEYSAGSAGPGTNPTPVNGDKVQGWAPLGTKGHVKLIRGHQFLEAPYAPQMWIGGPPVLTRAPLSAED